MIQFFVLNNKRLDGGKWELRYVCAQTAAGDMFLYQPGEVSSLTCLLLQHRHHKGSFWGQIKSLLIFPQRGVICLIVICLIVICLTSHWCRSRPATRMWFTDNDCDNSRWRNIHTSPITSVSPKTDEEVPRFFYKPPLKKSQTYLHWLCSQDVLNIPPSVKYQLLNLFCVNN